MSTLLRPVLSIIHIIYTIYILIKTQWFYLNNEIIRLINPKSLKLNECILNECDTSGLKKLPGHLIVVIGSENVSFVDIIKIIGWTVALGIPHVSFYDQDGVIKKQSNEFKKEYQKSKPDSYPKITWDFDKLNNNKNETNSYKSTTKIHFLCYKDGKGNIVNLTKDIAQAVTLGVLKHEEIDSNLINEKLSYNFPEPDLAIVFGNTFSTFGLLPWHIRLTAFFHLPTHHNIPPKSFINVLAKYGGCEQRYGK
ncbi:hypothetical protein HCN44_010287 [Aphidius gifuensis]|uniref:ditrans,polycis-polyprenyl diphosphate synthase [(2E,6E)-farnesyldiphosphate specific] n=1 Tax=Aphidius gifuensis TaxID=684658 RepID=A0A835CRV2_APHGI|nr:dehydrodolichyl diphosphate synthase complex subunit Nus1 [Aphidius gifuensis]KAF7993692.1 hypothetical protein HCN44_010287 [Aphidius gifuensis]